MVLTVMMAFPQEGGEGHAGAAASVGNHLHAVLCEPRRRRQRGSDRLHLLQLHPGVLPGSHPLYCYAKLTLVLAVLPCVG